jgi:hypothetical protein
MGYLKLFLCFEERLCLGYFCGCVYFDKRKQKT